MLKLIIGNKAYSSWSLRGWLACKHSGLLFEEITVPMFDEAWDKRTEGDEFAPSGGKVPILWDDQTVIWDSLAIIEWLADKTDRARYWPRDDTARGMARSMAAEMHSSYPNLRRELSMNVRKQFPTRELKEPVKLEVLRILELWAQARARHGSGGPYLFGAAFTLADVMYAPVTTRFTTWRPELGTDSSAYVEAVQAHPLMREWFAAAAAEPDAWKTPKYFTVPA